MKAKRIDKLESKMRELGIMLQARGDITEEEKKNIANVVWPRFNELLAEMLGEPEIQEALGDLIVVFELPEHRDFLTVELN